MQRSILLTAFLLGTLQTPALHAATNEELEQRVHDLEQAIAVLQRKSEIATEDLAATKSSVPVVNAGASGFNLNSADGSFKLKIRGYVQSDARDIVNDDLHATTDSFALRRVRPIFEGTVGNMWGFRIMTDFADGATLLQDAYVEALLAPELKIRLGKFKEPVGLERLASGSELKFVERGITTNLVPNRDVGIQAYGDLFSSRLLYQVGYFNGVADLGSSGSDASDKKELAGRLWATPFINEVGFLQNLGFGIAGTYGAKAGATDLGKPKTQAQAVFFSYRAAAVANGQAWRLSPQAIWTWNSFGLLGDYVKSSARVRLGQTSRVLDNDAWQGLVAWVVTGEEETFAGNIVPKTPLTLDGPGWGAVEVLARYGKLSIDNDAFPIFAAAATAAREEHSFGLGVNWYTSRNVKLTLNYEKTQFQGGAAAGKDRPDEDVIFSRFQVSY